MKTSIMILSATIMIAGHCAAQKNVQKEDGFLFGGGISGVIPVFKLSKTHTIGAGGDIAVEYLPKYNPGGLFDFNIWNDIVYSFSVGYAVFPGKDSVASGQKFRRKSYSVLPVFLGMKLVRDRKYTHIQLGWSSVKYTKTESAFAYAISWGLMFSRIDASIRVQGTIKENAPPGFFCGIRLGISSGTFAER